jgi:hypothetical protein
VSSEDSAFFAVLGLGSSLLAGPGDQHGAGKHQRETQTTAARTPELTPSSQFLLLRDGTRRGIAFSQDVYAHAAQSRDNSPGPLAMLKI